VRELSKQSPCERAPQLPPVNRIMQKLTFEEFVVATDSGEILCGIAGDLRLMTLLLLLLF